MNIEVLCSHCLSGVLVVGRMSMCMCVVGVVYMPTKFSGFQGSLWRTSPSYVTALRLVYMYNRGVEGAVSDVGAYVGIVVVVVVVVLVLVLVVAVAVSLQLLPTVGRHPSICYPEGLLDLRKPRLGV